MTDADRQRLAAILGMLGSEHAGERAAAALQAETFRKKHGLTWAELLAMQPVAPDPPVAPEQSPETHAPEPTIVVSPSASLFARFALASAIPMGVLAVAWLLHG